ncbi:SIMPL domain-containing protein [Nocardia higoensis]|uniref:SIMPL domain-containing protein n=1 Tax=Nocardia higoensis TaxID=228599 RepID=UPI000593C24D|nr:SIMPL domain-containing protein [Nocardia higoensis]
MSRDEAAAATVTVFGQGRVQATPDLLRLTVSVESRAERVAAAYARAGQRVAAVTASLRGNGVADADIATSGLTVRTETVWADNRERIVGYIAGTGLTVTLRRIGPDAVPGPAEIIAAAVDAGGDDVRLGGLVRTVADQDDLSARARDAAWDDALTKAQRYAQRAGRALGAVVEITENVAVAPQFAPKIRTVAMAEPAGGAPVPVELGETEIAASVRVTWYLG